MGLHLALSPLCTAVKPTFPQSVLQSDSGCIGVAAGYPPEFFTSVRSLGLVTCKRGLVRKDGQTLLQSADRSGHLHVKRTKGKSASGKCKIRWTGQR